MPHKDKDAETSLPIYAAHVSPKPTNVQEQDEPKLEGVSIPMLVLVNMPRMATQMVWASWWAAMGPYLGRILPSSAVWSVQIIGPLSSLIIGPIIGALSDRSTNPWGRRRPFLLWGAILNAVSLVAMGYSRDIGEALGDKDSAYFGAPSSTSGTAVVSVVLFAWMAITVSVVQTPLVLLVADIAGDRQTTGATLGVCWNIMGSVAITSYLEIVGPAYASLHYFLGFLAVMMLVTVGIVVAVVKEEAVQPSNTGVFHSVTSMPATLIIYGIVITIVSYGVTMYQGYRSMFFAIDVLDGTPEGSYFCEPDCTESQKNYNRGLEIFSNAHYLAYDAGTLVFFLVLPLFAHKFGAKAMLIASFVPQALLLVVVFTKVLTVAIIVDVAVTLFKDTALVLLVPTIIHVYGKNVNIGACVGVLTAVNGIGVMISVGVGISIVETSMGYRLPALLAGIFALVGIVVASVFLKLKMHML